MKNAEINLLHLQLFGLFETFGAIFNDPEFVREKYQPHVTLTKGKGLGDHQEANITQVYIAEWLPRKTGKKILSVIELKP